MSMVTFRRAILGAMTAGYHCGSPVTENHVPNILQLCPVDGLESLLDQFILKGSIC